MSDLEKILYTTAGTLVVGVFIFLVTRIIEVLTLKPLVKLREQIQQTVDRIDFYSKYLCNHFPATPSADQQITINQIRDDLRSAATQLKSKYWAIFAKNSLVRLGLIPSPEAVESAYSSLIYLHNSILFDGEVDSYNNTARNRNEIDNIKVQLMGIQKVSGWSDVPNP